LLTVIVDSGTERLKHKAANGSGTTQNDCLRGRPHYSIHEIGEDPDTMGGTLAAQPWATAYDRLFFPIELAVLLTAPSRQTGAERSNANDRGPVGV
jgi:hypothetical protein